jgi:hypothetical protein
MRATLELCTFDSSTLASHQAARRVPSPEPAEPVVGMHEHACHHEKTGNGAPQRRRPIQRAISALGGGNKGKWLVKDAFMSASALQRHRIVPQVRLVLPGLGTDLLSEEDEVRGRAIKMHSSEYTQLPASWELVPAQSTRSIVGQCRVLHAPQSHLPPHPRRTRAGDAARKAAKKLSKLHGIANQAGSSDSGVMVDLEVLEAEYKMPDPPPPPKDKDKEKAGERSRAQRPASPAMRPAPLCLSLAALHLTAAGAAAGAAWEQAAAGQAPAWAARAACEFGARAEAGPPAAAPPPPCSDHQPPPTTPPPLPLHPPQIARPPMPKPAPAAPTPWKTSRPSPCGEGAALSRRAIRSRRQPSRPHPRETASRHGRPSGVEPLQQPPPRRRRLQASPWHGSSSRSSRRQSSRQRRCRPRRLLRGWARWRWGAAARQAARARRGQPTKRQAAAPRQLLGSWRRQAGPPAVNA